MSRRKIDADTRDLVAAVRRAGDPELADALSHLRHTLVASPAPDEVAADHLSAIAASALVADTAVGAAADAGVATSASWGQRLRRVLGLTGAKLALTAGVAVAATGGLAAADQLPDPVQHRVADVASWFGVRLPDPAAEHVTEPPDESQAPEHVPSEHPAPFEVVPTDRPSESADQAPADQSVPSDAPAPSEGLPSQAPDVGDEPPDDPDDGRAPHDNPAPNDPPTGSAGGGAQDDFLPLAPDTPRISPRG